MKQKFPAPGSNITMTADELPHSSDWSIHSLAEVSSAPLSPTDKFMHEKVRNWMMLFKLCSTRICHPSTDSIDAYQERRVGERRKKLRLSLFTEVRSVNWDYRRQRQCSSEVFSSIRTKCDAINQFFWRCSINSDVFVCLHSVGRHKTDESLNSFAPFLSLCFGSWLVWASRAIFHQRCCQLEWKVLKRRFFW